MITKSYFVKCLVNDQYGKTIWGDIVDIPLFAKASYWQKELYEIITGIYGEDSYYQILDVKRV